MSTATETAPAQRIERRNVGYRIALLALGVLALLVGGAWLVFDLPFILNNWWEWAVHMTALLTGTPSTALVLAALIGLALVVTTWAVTMRQGHAVDRGRRVADWLAGDATVFSRGFCAALAFAMPLALYWPSMGYGYFLWDDFDLLLQSHRHGLGFLLPYLRGEHIFPLFWVQWELLWEVFGAWHPPYMLMTLLSLGSAVFAGMAVLRRAGAARGAVLAFAVLVVAWSPWAAMATGWNILAQYAQVVALALAGFYCLLRGGRRWAWAGAACALCAPLVAVAGIWVPCAHVGLAVTLTLYRREGVSWRTALRPAPLVVLVCLTAAYAAFYYWALQHRTLPSGYPEIGAHTPYTLAVQVLHYAFLGLALPLVVPEMSVMMPVYLRLLLAGAVGLAIAAFVGCTWLNGSRVTKALILGLLVALGGFGLLAALGRPEYTIYFDWDNRHTGQAWVLFSLLLALPISAALRWCARVCPSLAGPALLALAGGFALWNSGTGWVIGDFDHGWLGRHGYVQSLMFAEKRRAEVEALDAQLLQPLQAAFPNGAMLPKPTREDFRFAVPILDPMTGLDLYAVVDPELRDGGLRFTDSETVPLDPAVEAWLKTNWYGRRMYATRIAGLEAWSESASRYNGPWIWN